MMIPKKTIPILEEASLRKLRLRGIRGQISWSVVDPLEVKHEKIVTSVSACGWIYGVC